MATERIVLIVLGAVCALVPGSILAQVRADTLSLGEVQALLEAGNPMIQASASRVEAVGAMESAAGLPPDPELRLGVMNAGLPGLETDMPNSMAPAIELMQMVPTAGKLRLAREVARAETAMASAEAAGVRWMARSQAAMAYYDVYAADRQIETMRGTLRLLEDFEKVARAMYAAGEGRQADVLRASVEIARMQADIERMTAMRATATARLNGVLGRAADTPIDAVMDPPPAGTLPSFDILRGWAAESSPALARGVQYLEQARSRYDLARRELWPDLTLGLQYGQRSGEMGTERMGSLMVGFTLPIFARQKQMKMREEASAMSRMAEAELAGVQTEIDSRVAELLAEIGRARTLLDLYETDILPQANAAVESAFAAYRSGGVDFMTLVDARMTLDRYEQERYALRAEHEQAFADLEMTIGREIPRAPVQRREG